MRELARKPIGYTIPRQLHVSKHVTNTPFRHPFTPQMLRGKSKSRTKTARPVVHVSILFPLPLGPMRHKGRKEKNHIPCEHAGRFRPLHELALQRLAASAKSSTARYPGGHQDLPLLPFSSRQVRVPTPIFPPLHVMGDLLLDAVHRIRSLTRTFTQNRRGTKDTWRMGMHPVSAFHTPHLDVLWWFTRFPSRTTSVPSPGVPLHSTWRRCGW